MKKTDSTARQDKYGIYVQLREKFVMENARRDWKTYRDELTGLVNGYAGGSIAIVGAGRCDDIELSALDFENITLIDIDRAAMEQAVAGLATHSDKKVSAVEASLTGIGESDIESFCDNVFGFVRSRGRELTAEQFEDCLNRELDELEKKLSETEGILEGSLPEQAYDVILCSGVCSQLFSMVSFFIRSVSQSVADALFPEAAAIGDKAEKRLTKMNDMVIPVIDSAIMRASRKVAIFGNEDPADSPVEGAYQSICFVREHFKPQERSLMWDFNPAEQVQYPMKIQIAEKILEEEEYEKRA